VARILVGGLLVLLAFPAHGRAAAFEAGLVGGTNATYFNGDTPPDGSFQAQVSFAGGVHLAFQASPKVHFVVEPMVLQRTPTVEVDTGDELNPDVYKAHIDYVAVPVLARYVFAPGKLGVFVNGGAEFSFRGNATLEDPSGESSDIQDIIAKQDVGLLLGIGLRFPLGPFDASVETRHAFGLKNIAVGDPLGGEQGDVVWKSRASGLMFAVSYPLFGR